MIGPSKNVGALRSLSAVTTSVRVSRYTISAQADVYNALNSNVVLVANEVYGPALV